MTDEITAYGFTYGPMEVTRTSTLERREGDWQVLTIRTPYRELDIYCSPTGRSVRVFDTKTREELTR